MTKRTTNKKRKPLTQEEKQAKRDAVKAACEDIKKGMREIASSGEWQNFLNVYSAFHQYSMNNVWLIQAQMADRHERGLSPVQSATRCASYQAWKKANRQVKKGEKGLQILCPVPLKGTREVDGVEEEFGFIRFKLGHTFDISQTEGEDLPSLVTPCNDRKAVAKWVNKLKAFAESRGTSVKFGEIEGRANGYFVPSQNRIVVSKKLRGTQKLKTLIHEIAHSLLHSDNPITDARDPKHSTYAQGEVEAESVAYIVSRILGFDTSSYSFGYVTGWARAKPEMVDEAVKQISSGVKTILAGIEVEEPAAE